MMILTNEELYAISGGISVTGSLITAFSRALQTIFDIGRSLGTSINMVKYKKKC